MGLGAAKALVFPEGMIIPTILHSEAAKPEGGDLHVILKGMGSIPRSGSWLQFPAMVDLGRQQVIVHAAEFLPPKCKTHMELLSPSLGLT